jgi:hypothetical protein
MTQKQEEAMKRGMTTRSKQSKKWLTQWLVKSVCMNSCSWAKCMT